MNVQIRLQRGKIVAVINDHFLECPGLRMTNQTIKIHPDSAKTKGAMMDQSIYDKLSQYIAASILKQPNRVIVIDEPLISSGLIDSFSRVDISLFIEDNYGVIIDDKELSAEHLDTLDKFINLIEARRK